MKQDQNPDKISVEHFMAQFLAMKIESEDRLQDLADCLAEHHNHAAADIFNRTISLIQLYLAGLESYVRDMQLPEIAPWDTQWNLEEQLDSLCMEQAHYLMTPLQAQNLVLFNEKRIKHFCEVQLENTDDRSSSNLIQEVLDKQQEQISQMQSWSEMLDDINDTVQDDYDPPNMPE